MQTQLFVSTLTSALLASCALTLTAQAQLQSKLTLQVAGIRGNQGSLCYKVFANAQGFPNGNQGAVKRQCSKILGSAMSFNVGSLRSGSYAVAIYHDKNGNGKFDRNSVGMPIEGYGFSQNPIVTNRAPNFGDCLVLLAGSGLTTQIKLQYP